MTKIVLFLLATLAAFNFINCIQMYETCQELKDNTPTQLLESLTDGFHYLQLKPGVGVQVYCTGLSQGSNTQPTEYLHLQSGRSSNYAEMYRYVGSDQACTLEKLPEEDFQDFGRTEFEKVKVDLRTKTVFTDDFTYATTVSGSPVKFGHAGDKHSFSPECTPMGKFSIDFTGTPWTFNRQSEWRWEGNYANGDNSIGSPLIQDGRYIGCYNDQADRDLPLGPVSDSQMTAHLCIMRCTQQGYKYAGTQYAKECFCGDTYGSHGKADESKCDWPCTGNSDEMCGGHYANSVYRVGIEQSRQGRCGGYPGTCFPTMMSQSGVIMKVTLYEQHPCLVANPCKNSAMCVATNVDNFFCSCHVGFTGTYCEVIEESLKFESPPTASHDDATAYVACPAGMMATQCECKARYCDGVWFQGDECRVSNSGQGQTSIGIVTCWPYDPTHLYYVNVESKDMHNPTAQCLENSLMTSCASLDYWWTQVTYGKGTYDNSTSPPTCRQDYCQTSTNGCKVQARCLMSECGCQNGGSCIHISGQCACPDGFYGSKCESFDYCAFYEDQNGEPPCQNGGSCAGVPSHVVATVGGTGGNKNCRFPFTMQEKTYSKCVDSNLIGPPFACAAVLDGHDSYIDLGKWNPGPVYTMEVWVRASSIPDGRQAVAGGFDVCRDWGIGMEGGYFKAFYKPIGDCTRAIQYPQRVEIGRWYYLVKTNDGTTAKFYVDGTLIDSAQVEKMLPGTANGFYVGGEECCGNYFPGEVKSLRVWKRDMSAAEISESYMSEHLAHDKSTENALNKGLVGYWDFGESVHPPCEGTDHMGGDWYLNDGDEISGVHCNISHFVVPDYCTVRVKAWNGGDKQSGKLEIYAKDIDIYGVLTATGKGYRGGEPPGLEQESGKRGETYTGGYPTPNGVTANVGGGGGGGGELDGTNGHGKPGGGGGYGSAGGTCKLRPGMDVSHCGEGGSIYGDDKLSVLYLGSGGGSGGNDNKLTDNPHGGRGGNGGGAIRLDALRHIEVVGYVQVNGDIGEGDTSTSCDVCPSACQDQSSCAGGSTTSCWDFSGAGGGGSGGSLYLRGQVVNVGLNHISANGGRGGHGAYAACGGDGGNGRVRIDYVQLIGQYPSYVVANPFDKTFTDKSYIGQQQIDLSNTVYGNEVYLGCFQDDVGDRHMEFVVPQTDEVTAKMTPQFCIEKCRENNYRYAGTQFAYECFCDNQIGKLPRTVESECAMPCRGDAEQFCGGNQRLTMYGPPPLSGAATEHNGVVQECKPWCVNSAVDEEMTWGECVNDGYISEYEIACKCADGFSGENCGQTCPPSTYGKGCSLNCACVAANTQLCDPQTGSCLCKDGFHGERCQYACADGTWGSGCSQTCQQCGQNAVTSTCDAGTGACQCQAGYTGYSCESTCPSGKWGLDCQNACSCQNGACAPVDGSCTCYAGYQGSTCNQACDEYSWGNDCVLTCDCNGYSCNSKTGECVCPPTTTGSKCENGCPPNMWGSTCTNNCNCGSNAQGCDQDTGSCHCDAGFTGTLCDLECPVGMFGVNCAYACSCTTGNIKRCHPTTGQCECKPGYHGVQCQSLCSAGTYGDGCSSTCGCQGGVLCDPISGSCDQCPDGFVGDFCENACPVGKYGERCQSTCNCNSASMKSCDGVTGACYCKAGYTGERCEAPCDITHWGENCMYVCQCVSYNTESCDGATGICICKPGFSGQTCENQCTGNQCLGTGCNCQNNGLCLTDGSCDCLEGFYGVKCESPCPSGKFGKDCAYNCVCQNGATCSAADGSCTCAPGYQYADCSVPCSPGYFGQGCTSLCQCVSGTCSNVDGSCQCNPGFTGTTCANKCPQGYYGQGCASFCNCDSNTGSCDHVTGFCQCSEGYTGSDCRTPCPQNKFGANCVYTCPNCGTNASPGCDSATGECQCNPGFQSTYCDQSCSPGFYGQDCALRCPYDCKNFGLCDAVSGNCNCAPGYTGNDCTQMCLEGYYGANCQAQCGCVSSQSDHCNSLNGECHCLSGYTGDLCESACPPGYFGDDCTSQCTCNPSTSSCNPSTGFCSCLPGYLGSDCSTTCPVGSWGADCVGVCFCSQYASGCDPQTGVCTCLPGYRGDLCESECPVGTWGSNCAYQCDCLNEGVCDHRTGTCKCAPGFTGHRCEQACTPPYFGYNCAQICACDGSCDPVSGSCVCEPGWTGSNCQTACGSGFWGSGCVNQCSQLCPIAQQCDIVTGVCLCPSGLSGMYCNTSCTAGRWGLDCAEFCQAPCTSECDTQNGLCFCGNLQASCKNGGECQSGSCRCPSGYGGNTCTDIASPIDGGASSGAIAAAVIVSLLVAIVVGLAVYLIYFKRQVDLSKLKLSTLTQIFSREEDSKTLYDKDGGVAIDNPNYGFDTDA